MASPVTIEKLPSDVSAMVCKLLTLEDIKKLRQVCRWAEKETFNEFAGRGYYRITLRVSKTAVEGLGRVLESERLAASVRELHVVFQEIIRFPCAQESVNSRYYGFFRNLRTAAEQQTPLDEAFVPAVIARLSRLEVLKLVGLSSRSILLQCDPEDIKSIAAAPEVARQRLDVRVVASILTAEELTSLFAAFKNLAKSIYLVEIVSTATQGLQKQWHEVFLALRSLQLEQLGYCRLRYGKIDRHGYDLDFDVLRRNERVHRGFRGAKGIEYFTMHYGEADMHGGKAVAAGIDMVLERLTSRQ